MQNLQKALQQAGVSVYIDSSQQTQNAYILDQLACSSMHTCHLIPDQICKLAGDLRPLWPMRTFEMSSLLDIMFQFFINIAIFIMATMSVFHYPKGCSTCHGKTLESLIDFEKVKVKAKSQVPELRTLCLQVTFPN